MAECTAERLRGFRYSSQAENTSSESSTRAEAVLMPDEIADWKQIAAALHVALPQIHQALSQANVPIARRKLKAFDIVQDTMLDVPDP